MNQSVVTFADDNGRAVLYKRYSSRVPAFLKRFPPEQGYRVETEMTDLLSLQKGRLSLLKEAIAAGRKLSDIGLPGIEKDMNTLVCRARLYDQQGLVIRDASASMDVLEHKDYETLETAACQRLFAQLGFGGEVVLDAAEDQDFQRQNLKVTASGSHSQAASGQTEYPSTPQPAAADGLPQESMRKPASKKDEVSPALRRQVENLARRLGESVPEMATQQQADAALARFGELQRQRRESSAA